MKELVLQIQLLSPAAPSGGEGMPGQVDRDVCFDGRGLPILPGRRLKGLLREAYVDAYEALTASGGASELPEASVLFGSPGNSHSGALHVRSARLDDAPSLESWFDWL